MRHDAALLANDFAMPATEATTGVDLGGIGGRLFTPLLFCAIKAVQNGLEIRN